LTIIGLYINFAKDKSETEIATVAVFTIRYNKIRFEDAECEMSKLAARITRKMKFGLSRDNEYKYRL
jgi:hypothetical protein